MKTPYIRLDNEKVACPVWNLPAIQTCPGSTPLCRRYCYAAKAEREYSKNEAAPCRARNLAFVKANADRLADILTAADRCVADQYIRIHESGDFFNQDYLDSWFEVARRLPSIKFLAFTKSFSLDWRCKPSNFVVIWSVWPDTNMANVPSGRRAYAGAFEPRRPTVECPGACADCRKCWNTNLDIHFRIH